MSQSTCDARPHVEDKRTCELPAGHSEEQHLISGVSRDKFGEHPWRLTWRDSSHQAVAPAARPGE